MIRFELQTGLTHRMYIRPEDIVWFGKDNSPGGGVVLCYSRGTKTIRESIDQVLAKLPVKPVKFTINGGEERIPIYVMPKHVLSVTVTERGRPIIRLTRGEFEIMQSLDVAMQDIGEPI